MVKAWRNLETFIVHDFQWTATVRHADIALPATTSATTSSKSVTTHSAISLR